MFPEWGFSDTLAELGATLLVVADSAEADLLDILDVLGVEHLIGPGEGVVPDRLKEFAPDLLITSPGVRPDSAVIQWAEHAGIPIWVDIDLAWRLRDKTERVAQWFCITGTNGKTTTTQLTTAMLQSGDIRAVAVGNIGTPILDAIRDPQGFDALVVELSSFQLHYLNGIEPHSSVVLNLADDHLDWHGSMDAYAAAKVSLLERAELAIVNHDDALAVEFSNS